jgi:hypothetical protein
MFSGNDMATRSQQFNHGSMDEAAPPAGNEDQTDFQRSLSEL